MARPEKLRRVCCAGHMRTCRPIGRPAVEVETLRLDELEALRLADLNGLYQEAAAERMRVPRPTFSRILASAKQARCPGCGVALVREGSPHHQEIVQRRSEG